MKNVKPLTGKLMSEEELKESMKKMTAETPEHMKKYGRKCLSFGNGMYFPLHHKESEPFYIYHGASRIW